MHLAILGAGQLGGSFARALREADAAVTITAYDIDSHHAEFLLADGTVDAVAASPAQTATGADIVLLASPLRSYGALAAAIAPVLKSDAIVTDIGSVKASMQKLRGILPAARLVPGHPIAGSEKSGPAVANPALFHGRLCILTPEMDADESAIQAIETLWHLVGADVLRMPTEVHDQVYAQVSHLPHIIAFASAQFLAATHLRLTADDGMLRQFLRISQANPRMWTDVALENREALLGALATYTALLAHFSEELRSGEPGKQPEPEYVSKTLLPRILAASLISAVSLYEQQSGIALRGFSGGGMRDICAPAANSPEADIHAISDAAGAVASMIGDMLPYFRRIELLIGAEDEPGLFAALSAAQRDAQALLRPAN